MKSYIIIIIIAILSVLLYFNYRNTGSNENQSTADTTVVDTTSYVILPNTSDEVEEEPNAIGKASDPEYRINELFEEYTNTYAEIRFKTWNQQYKEKYGTSEEFSKHVTIIRKEILNDDDNLFRCLILFKYPSPIKGYWYTIIEASQSIDDYGPTMSEVGKLDYDIMNQNAALNYFDSLIRYE